MESHHDWDNWQKKPLKCGLVCSFRGLVHYHQGREYAGRQAGMMLEILLCATAWSAGNSQRVKLDRAWAFEIINPTHYQWHTSSNKAMLPRPYQTVPLTVGQAVKHQPMGAILVQVTTHGKHCSSGKCSYESSKQDSCYYQCNTWYLEDGLLIIRDATDNLQFSSYIWIPSNLWMLPIWIL